MDEVARTRLKVVVVLAFIVVLLHVIVIRFCIIGSRGENEKKPGAPVEEKSAAPAKESVKPVEPVKPEVRFFVKSSNPHFGWPLDYRHARHGDLPPSIVPGSKAVKAGIIVDMNSRRVLWEKNGKKAVQIASMTKMMTMLLVMESMEQRPELKLSDYIPVSKTVMTVKRTGVLYLAPGERFTILELLIATAVKSANDAATLLGEYFGNGSVENFVARMNRRAAELNLKSVRFCNPCGLPDSKGNHAQGSPEEMVLLGEQLLQYPVVLQWCQMKKGSIRRGKTIFENTNGLVRRSEYARICPGIDGLKTGYLNSAGCCVTFSVLRDNRRIIGCVTGVPTGRERDLFCRHLINWAYQQK